MREINDWEDLNAKTLLLRGIYANGLLVESCSKRYLTEISNMRILGQEDCAVSQDVDKVLIQLLVETY